jgi:hypothetical protein
VGGPIVSSICDETSIRHLFRHLYDPRELRRNPIVSSFFIKRQNGWEPARDEDAESYRIRELVRRVSERYCTSSAAIVHPERAARQFTIVIESCLERKPVRQIAARLRISLRQYYKERSEICAFIAEHLRQAAFERIAEATVSDADWYLEQAAARAKFGDYDGALRDYQRIVHSAELCLERAALLQAQASLEATALLLAIQKSPS